MSDMQTVVEKLHDMAVDGYGHDDLIKCLQGESHKGYDIADDKSLMVAWFDDGVIIVAPYAQVSMVRRADV